MSVCNRRLYKKASEKIDLQNSILWLERSTANIYVCMTSYTTYSSSDIDRYTTLLLNIWRSLSLQHISHQHARSMILCERYGVYNLKIVADLVHVVHVCIISPNRPLLIGAGIQLQIKRGSFELQMRYHVLDKNTNPF